MDKKLPTRVLIVDDNVDAASSMAFLLTSYGYDVETAFDPFSALDCARLWRPDACVLDINMPGMTGYELASRLRAMFPGNVPILATVTAYEDDKHFDRAVEAGFDLHFTKPAVAWDVAEQLREYLENMSGGVYQLPRERTGADGSIRRRR